MSFSFTSVDISRLFSSPDIKQSTIELVIDALIREEKSPAVEDVRKAIKKLGISFDPVSLLEKFNIVKIQNNKVVLHPIVSEELDLWPHLLEILRNRFGLLISRRIYQLGRYLHYIDSLPAQLQFLDLNLNIEKEVLHDAIKAIFTISVETSIEPMSFQEALRYFKYKEDLNTRAKAALRALGENMHLLTRNDVTFLKKSLLTIDKVASQVDDVKKEFSRFSVDAFLSGTIKLDDIMDFENIDELVTLSLLMKMENLDKIEAFSISDRDPVSKLIKNFLNRNLPASRRKAIIRMISKFFREFFVREGFSRDLNALIQAFYHKEFDLKKTLFKTMKKMEIWTPVFKKKIKASSRSMILVNDLSGSMIASYIGQVEMYHGLIEAITEDVESEIVFISFSNDTLSFKQTSLGRTMGKEDFLDLLTQHTMGMTDINAALQTLKTGIPSRGDTFKPPDPDETIVFFISDLQETIGGAIDYELVESVIKKCNKFYISIPRNNFNEENYEIFVESGAIPVIYDKVVEIPMKIVKLMTHELAR
ncbi:MAG: VWA domain-containing protein [Promethearchaeota archaeon]